MPWDWARGAVLGLGAADESPQGFGDSIECASHVSEGTPASVGEWIISHNLKRRHLTPSQAAAVATEYEEYLKDSAKERQEEAALRGNRNRGADSPVPENFPEPIKDHSKEASEQAGQMLGVSGRSVRDAKAVKKADPELFSGSGSNIH